MVNNMSNKVMAERIQELLSKVTVEFHNPEGRTVTFAHAYIGTFLLLQVCLLV